MGDHRQAGASRNLKSRPECSSSSRSWNGGRPCGVSEDCWRLAEGVVQRVVWTVEPNEASHRTRMEVIDYVRSLISDLYGCEVYAFGSVPFQTYLPEGDIDLTTYGDPSRTDYLASGVLNLLEAEAKSEDAEYEIKDVQHINAEVKLVKCLVDNIIVDVSFNQIGGLYTLAFLERVNAAIGKNNLFKRSIILIKAWCYYESHILGAQHSLLSTYALETLVLYIFHFFHSSLDGPFAVLHRFLNYFSKFDWDNLCITLHGPVHLSFLPELVVEITENDGSDRFFTKQFFNECKNMLAFHLGHSANCRRLFAKKHFNIADPLKENNNLGRSISKGNSYRIRSALAYGAQKLQKILLLPRQRMQAELNIFFTNTLQRHWNGESAPLLDQYLCPPNVTPINPSNLANTWQSTVDGMLIPSMHKRLQRDINNNMNDIKICDKANLFQQMESRPNYSANHGIYSAQQEINHTADRVVNYGIFNGSCLPHATYMHMRNYSQCVSPFPLGMEDQNSQKNDQHQFHQRRGLPSQVNTNGLVSSVSAVGLQNNRMSNTYPSSWVSSASPISTTTSRSFCCGVAVLSRDSKEEDDGPSFAAYTDADFPPLNGSLVVHDSVDHSGEHSIHHDNHLNAQHGPVKILTTSLPFRSPQSHFQNSNLPNVPQQANMFRSLNMTIPLFHSPPAPSHYQSNTNSRGFGIGEGSAKCRGTGPYFPTSVTKNRNRTSLYARGKSIYISNLPPRHRSLSREMIAPDTGYTDSERGDDGSEKMTQSPSQQPSSLDFSGISPRILQELPGTGLHEQPDSLGFSDSSAALGENPEASVHKSPCLSEISDTALLTLSGKSKASIHEPPSNLEFSGTSPTLLEHPESGAVDSQLQNKLNSESCEPVQCGNVEPESTIVIETDDSGSSSSSVPVLPSVLDSQTCPSPERLAQPYELKDDKDFPPLSLQVPPHINRNKEKINWRSGKKKRKPVLAELVGKS